MPKNLEFQIWVVYGLLSLSWTNPVLKSWTNPVLKSWRRITSHKRPKSVPAISKAEEFFEISQTIVSMTNMKISQCRKMGKEGISFASKNTLEKCNLEGHSNFIVYTIRPWSHNFFGEKTSRFRVKWINKKKKWKKSVPVSGPSIAYSEVIGLHVEVDAQ